MDKKCNVCGETKNISEFHSNGYYKATKAKKYKPSCRKCESKQKRARLNKIISDFYGGFKCQKCGLEDDPIVFDAHHRDPSEKEARLSSMATYSEERIIAELKKCDLLCAGCHRKLHAGID